MQTSNLNGDADTDILRSLQDYSDVASWINDVLEEDEASGEVEDGGEGKDEGESVEYEYEHDLTELERRVSHLSAILEVACEDTSAQLEKTIDDVSRTVPRLTYDLALMQESALSLQKALQGVERHSSAFLNSRSNVNIDINTTVPASAKEEEEEGGKAKSEIVPVLEQLYYLDTVKRNMEASLAVLREAEAWSSLESEVVSYLSEQAYSKAASRLSEASKSLGVFQNTPEYETRKTLMTNLQNQLEAALSSALVAGINNNDVDACKRFFDIFCHIERETEFRSYWNGSKRKGIVSLWQETKLRDCGDNDINPSVNPESKKFSTFMPEFYHEILSVLQVERLSVVLIFPDPQPSLSTFITSTLSSLHPSLSQRLNALVTYYGDFVLPELISSFKATEEFAVATGKIMEKVGYSSFSPAVVPGNLEDRENASTSIRSNARRRSTRLSFSRRLNRSSISGPPVPIGAGAGTGSGPASLDHTWEEALFEPFLDYQCDYATLEERILRAQLKDLLVPSASTITGDGGSGSARLLRERAIDVLSFADEALTRCMAFTHGYGIVGLIQALDDLFETFLHSARQEVLESGGGSNAEPGGGGTFDFESESRQEFAELDYSPSDLATFQLSLHFLEAARGVLERLVVFETKLHASVLTTSSALRMVGNDPFGSYVSGTTHTALSLLQSSVLNSVELQSLLDAADPEQQSQQQQYQQVALSHSAFTPSSATFAGAQKTGGPGPAARSVASAVLLNGARNAVSEFAKACQMRLQETLLAPLFKHLSSYTSLPVWSSSSDPKDRSGSTTGGGSGGGSGGGGGGGAVNEVIIPTFSLSPSNAIQRVAEGLLSLPRLFEVYADDDALAFSIETLPYIDAEKLLAMSAETASIAESEANAAAVTATNATATANNEGSSRPKARHYPSSTSSLSIQVSSYQHSSSSSTQPKLILTPETVSSAWLTSLTLTLFSHLTSRILPSFPRITSAGTAQLSEDLSYLAQIGRALGVEWATLEAWREGVRAEEEEVRRKVGELRSSLSTANINDGGVGEKTLEEVLEVWKGVAKLRGIAI